MKANTLQEVLIISIIVLSLSVGSLFVLKELSTESYNLITGQATARSTVNITARPFVPCSFTLESGLNLVSFFCIGESLTPSEVFGNLTGLEGVWSYEKGSSDPWKVYNPNLPSEIVSDLSLLSRRKGYFMRMNTAEAFFHNGTLPSTLSLALVPGYNLLGYTSNESRAINISLASMDGNYSKVVGFDSGSQIFLSYIPGSGGSLSTTDPFNGYWINATVAETWVINN